MMGPGYDKILTFIVFRCCLEGLWFVFYLLACALLSSLLSASSAVIEMTFAYNLKREFLYLNYHK